MFIRQTAKLRINSMCIALLIHGFVPVKTWLLIACDTDFIATRILCNNTKKMNSKATTMGCSTGLKQGAQTRHSVTDYTANNNKRKQ